MSAPHSIGLDFDGLPFDVEGQKGTDPVQNVRNAQTADSREAAQTPFAGPGDGILEGNSTSLQLRGHSVPTFGAAGLLAV